MSAQNVTLVRKTVEFKIAVPVRPTIMRQGLDPETEVARELRADPRRVAKYSRRPMLVEEIKTVTLCALRAETMVAVLSVTAEVVNPTAGETISVGPGCKWRRSDLGEKNTVSLRLRDGTIQLRVPCPSVEVIEQLLCPMSVAEIRIVDSWPFNGIFVVSGEALSVTRLSD